MTTLTVNNQSFTKNFDWLDHAGLGTGALMVARAHRRGAERLIEGLALAGGALASLFQTRPAVAEADLERARTVSSKRIGWLDRAVHRLMYPADWELERYLANSTDCADLEFRMRTWARRRNGF